MLQKLTPAILAEAMTRIAAGELDEYFAAHRTRRSIRTRVEAAWQTYRASPISAAYEQLYTATRRTPGTCVHSAEFRAQMLQNAAMHCILRARFDRGIDPIEACRRIDEAHDALHAVIAAWLAWRAR